MRIKSRHIVRKDYAKKLLNDLKSMFGEGADFFEGKKMEIVETDEIDDLILVDGEPLLLLTENEPFLTIKGALKVKPTKRKVIVDMGAVKYVSSGANVMCPGITYADTDIKEGDFVVIVDELHDKAIAIGKALIQGNEMVADKGKAIKCIHYVGDKIWNF